MIEGLPQLLKLMETSGPTALVGVIFAAAWWLERRENREQSQRLLRLATAQIQANTKLVASIRALRELIRQNRD